MFSHDQLTTWRAANWPHLTSIWRELVGPADVLQRPDPRFQNQTITPQQAGYVFQTLVMEGFRLGKAEIDEPFTVPINPGKDDRTLQQLDGLTLKEWQGFLIESKFGHVDFDPIARLHLLVDSRPSGVLGLLFAADGFTLPALESAHILRPIRVLLFNRGDIERAIELCDFMAAVRLKWKLAVKFGRSGLSITDLPV